MKEEDKILQKVGTENPFRVPDGYFERFTSEMMSKLPEKEHPVDVCKEPTRWERIRPWVYMAAMFAGAALIARVASTGSDVQNDVLAAEEDEIEVEYINRAMDSSMMDDYSMYVYLTSGEFE